MWILHLIDVATRYAAACLIRRGKKVSSVSYISDMGYFFGAPGKFQSDCSREFCEMNKKLGTKTSSTPGGSLFGNGVAERNNKVLYESLMKAMEDEKCDMEIGLAWAVSAKNALKNHSGYSTNQLVFGTNVNLPSVITDLALALESFTSSDIVR